MPLPDSPLCPVRAFKLMCTLVPAPSDAPAFCRIRHGSNYPIHAAALDRFLKTVLKLAVWTYILETEEASSYLGVTFTANLTWDKHIQAITNKGNRTLDFIRRNLRECSVPVKAATNAQATHSRIGRRISHGYDRASSVAIRISP